MAFEFDPAKNATNIAKHGVSLSSGQGLFEVVDRLVVATIRIEDGEQRFKVIAAVDGRLWTAIYTHRGEAVRIISVRKSNEAEQRTYHRDFR